MKKSRVDTADTRKHILSTASRLFLQHGLADTGIANIMAAAGLTPGGFYRHFDSKDQLIAEANKAANERMFDVYSAAVAQQPPLEALDTVVHLYLHQSHIAAPGGQCPLPNLGSELRQAGDQVRNSAMDGYQRLVATFSTLTGALGVVDHAGVAEAIVATLVGAVMLARLAPDVGAAQAILDSTKTAVGALLQQRQA